MSPVHVFLLRNQRGSGASQRNHSVILCLADCTWVEESGCGVKTPSGAGPWKKSHTEKLHCNVWDRWEKRREIFNDTPEQEIWGSHLPQPEGQKCLSVAARNWSGEKRQTRYNAALASTNKKKNSSHCSDLSLTCVVASLASSGVSWSTVWQTSSMSNRTGSAWWTQKKRHTAPQTRSPQIRHRNGRRCCA